MLRAFSLQWRAKVSRYGLAVGFAIVVATWASLFVFQHRRIDGMREFDVAFPSSPRPQFTPAKTVPAPGFERAVQLSATLPDPPLECLPGVLCGWNNSVEFGCSIDQYGNTLAVGAHDDDTAGLEAGAVHIYERDIDHGRWNYQARILADPHQKLAARTLGRRQARFGRRVALANGVLAVLQGSLYPGGPPEDSTDQVYVFSLTTSGSNEKKGQSQEWRQEARLPTPENGQAHGLWLAFLDAQTLLAAAPKAKPLHHETPSGAVYVYRRKWADDDSWKWRLIGQLRPPRGSGGDLRFGVSLQTSGDLIAVGMTDPRGATKADSGRTWGVPLFRRKGLEDAPERWDYLGLVPAPDHATADFGATLALHGTTLAVFQGWEPRQGTEECRTPRVFVYRAPKPDSRASEWHYQGELPQPLGFDIVCFGPSLATDGQSIAVGAIIAGIGEVRPGLVFVYRAADNGQWALHQTMAPPNPMNYRMGFGSVLSLQNGLLMVRGTGLHSDPLHGSVFIRSL